MDIVKLENISIQFKKVKDLPKFRYTGRSLTSIFRKRKKQENFWALKDISFNLKERDILGIIGKNGAGKSTLLKVISKVLIPDTGKISITGNVTSLLTFGVGFLPDLTGKENIYLSCMFLGLKKKEVDTIYNDIIRFSEIEEFIHTKARYYSTGMLARLGFSVAIHVKPEILIVDEVLSAGDIGFQKKAEEKIKRKMENTKVVLIVSHNNEMIRRLCNQCLWLENGQIKRMGEPRSIIEEYKRQNENVMN